MLLSIKFEAAIVHGAVEVNRELGNSRDWFSNVDQRDGAIA
jgi:hypothetical protein